MGGFGGAGGMPGGFHFTSGTGPGGAYQFSNEDAERIFAGLFGGRGGSPFSFGGGSPFSGRSSPHLDPRYVSLSLC